MTDLYKTCKCKCTCNAAWDKFSAERLGFVGKVERLRDNLRNPYMAAETVSRFLQHELGNSRELNTSFVSAATQTIGTLKVLKKFL